MNAQKVTCRTTIPDAGIVGDDPLGSPLAIIICLDAMTCDPLPISANLTIPNPNIR